MENASAAFLEAVRRSMKAIRQVLESTVIDPALLTCAERIQYDGFLRRQEDSQSIKALAEAGKSIKEITRSTGRSRKLVRGVLRGGDGDVFRSRQSVLEPYVTKLRAEWDAGCRNGAELWRRMGVVGFRGSLRVVTEWVTRQRRSEKADVQLARRAAPARLLSRLMTVRRAQLTKTDAVTVAAIEAGVLALAVARDLMDRFHCMLRARDIGGLPGWLAETGNSILASFGKGIAADLAAVKAALSEPWSNGQAEGQITKLKLVKRQMYGRAHLDSSVHVSLPPRETRCRTAPRLSQSQFWTPITPRRGSIFHAVPQLHHSHVLAIRGDSYRLREKRRSGLIKATPAPASSGASQ